MQVSTTWALTCLQMVHQRPYITREIETWLSDSTFRVGNNSVVAHRSQRPVLFPQQNCVDRCHVWPYWASRCKLWRLMLKDISIHRPIWMGFDDLKCGTGTQSARDNVTCNFAKYSPRRWQLKLWFLFDSWYMPCLSTQEMRTVYSNAKIYRFLWLDHWIRDRPKRLFLVTAATETGAEIQLLVSAVTVTRPKLTNALRP